MNCPSSSARSISTTGLERLRHGKMSASAMISTASVAAPIVPIMRRSARAANTAARDTVAVTISG